MIAGGVGIVGVIGSTIASVTSVRNTRRSVRDTIDHERRQRLWEKQAAAYEDVVKEMLLRRTQREYALGHGDIGAGPTALRELLRRSDDPETIRIKALLLAYGSVAVQRAYEDSEQFTAKVTQATHHLNHVNDMHMKARIGKEPNAEHLEPLPDYGQALSHLHALKAEAFEVDQRLFDAINHELAWNSTTSNSPSLSEIRQLPFLGRLPSRPRSRRATHVPHAKVTGGQPR